MKESQFYQLAKRSLPGWTWDRVENLVSSGIPDTLIYHGFVKRQLELKIIRSGKMTFEPSQISWARRMIQGNVWGNYVLAWDGEQPILMDYFYVLDKAYGDFEKKKYTVVVKDVPNKIMGWRMINAMLGGKTVCTKE